MANKIWIVLQHRDGKLHRMSWEAIAAGQKLAAATGGDVEAVILGSDIGGLAEEVATASLAAVRVADRPELADYTPGGYVTALAGAMAAGSPELVIFPHTYQTAEYMARLGQATGAAIVPEITDFESVDEGTVWQRPVLGGKLVARMRAKPGKTALVSVQSGSFSVDDVEKGGTAAVEELAIEGEVAADREILAVEEAASGEVDLSQSDYIVSVGRGIGGEDKLGVAEDLARALGADIGASRPVIDSGWLPRERQIGSSGQTVTPKIYVAVGISGAIQHLVGMKGSQVIVAVNKDPSAPIFNVAQYGIVGDVHEILPALTAAIEEAKSG